MNFRARVRRLEKNANVGGFCLCHGKPMVEAFCDISSKDLKAYRLPDFCDKCQRPINKSGIKISFEQYQAQVAERVRQAAATMALFED